jgi:hypothetical protein
VVSNETSTAANIAEVSPLDSNANITNRNDKGKEGIEDWGKALVVLTLLSQAFARHEDEEAAYSHIDDEKHPQQSQ